MLRSNDYRIGYERGYDNGFADGSKDDPILFLLVFVFGVALGALATLAYLSH